MRKAAFFPLAVLVVLVTACGGQATIVEATFTDGGDTGGDGTGDEAGLPGSFKTDGGTGTASSCDPPDLLIVLDRTLSMANEPDGKTPPNTPAGHALAKWSLAVDAVRAMTAPPTDATLRFGLELFPLNPGGTACPTLGLRLGGQNATNKTCAAGEIAVPIGTGQGATIAAAIDAETTPLCVSTPITAALGTAEGALKMSLQAGRKQFIVLVTDGGYTCAVNPLASVQALAAAGINTYVVGFGTVGGANGVKSGVLNDLACAGRTASNFATACAKDAAGDYSAVKKGMGTLFFTAETGATLSSALKSVAGSVCCGCAK